jgi:molecular chaperone DnaJ
VDARKEWLEDDYYAELGVETSTSAEEITKAYRKLARQFHPDTNPDAAAEDRFKKITAAYDVLGDEERRQQYDEVRRFGAGVGARAGTHGQAFDFDAADLEDLFGGMFGGQGPFTRGRGSGGQVFTTFDGRPSSAPPMRGADQEAVLALSFAEAIRGMTTTVTVSDGSGRREIKVRIPAGVNDGQTLRLAGKGGKGRSGGPDGDLLVLLSVGSDPVFGRNSRDLTIDVPISYAEAVLGATISVPTFGGGSVSVKIPPGTASGRTFRVKGRGIETPKGTGNLLVKVYVTVPESMSDEAADALRAYSAASGEEPRRNFGGL